MGLIKNCIQTFQTGHLWIPSAQQQDKQLTHALRLQGPGVASSSHLRFWAKEPHCIHAYGLLLASPLPSLIVAKSSGRESWLEGRWGPHYWGKHPVHLYGQRFQSLTTSGLSCELLALHSLSKKSRYIHKRRRHSAQFPLRKQTTDRKSGWDLQFLCGKAGVPVDESSQGHDAPSK